MRKKVDKQLCKVTGIIFEYSGVDRPQSALKKMVPRFKFFYSFSVSKKCYVLKLTYAI